VRGARAPATSTGAAAHLVATLGLRGGGRGAFPGLGTGASSGPLALGPDRSGGCRERSQRPPKWQRAHQPARGQGGLRASSRELRRPGTRGCQDGACLASGPLAEAGGTRAVVGRSRGRRSRGALGRQAGRGRHPKVEARVRQGGVQRLPPGGTPTEVGGHTEDTQRDIRRHLPWGSFPFGESSTGDR